MNKIPTVLFHFLQCHFSFAIIIFLFLYLSSYFLIFKGRFKGLGYLLISVILLKLSYNFYVELVYQDNDTYIIHVFHAFNALTGW